jgi:kynurenine formamidase
MIIDLTRTLENGQQGVSLATKYIRDRDGWNAQTLELYSHTGTHLDAPAHFLDGDKTVEQMPLSDCMGAAHVVDLTALEPKALIEVGHLGASADTFHSGDSLLLHTGWSKNFDDFEYYRGNFPRVSEGLARWCAEHGVKMLGVEAPSVADVNNLPEVTLVHEILLGAGIVIVEGLVNLEQIPGPETFFAALPLKVGGGDGTPCRAFAVDGDLNQLA